jgi:hypothetical protein
MLPVGVATAYAIPEKTRATALRIVERLRRLRYRIPPATTIWIMIVTVSRTAMTAIVVLIPLVFVTMTACARKVKTATTVPVIAYQVRAPAVGTVFVSHISERIVYRARKIVQGSRSASPRSASAAGMVAAPIR